MTRAQPHPSTTAPSGLPREPGRGDDYDRFRRGVRDHVEARLATWLAARVSEASRRGDSVGDIARAMADLALRGGKRLRPIVLAASLEACGGDGLGEDAALGGVALELLQAYFLAHDDWMDGDDTRRGGPSMPAMMRAIFTPERAAAATILGGDLAAAWARRAILEIRAAAPHVVSAALELARIEDEVVSGQVLDMSAAAKDPAQVEAMHALKTSSYTVRGPVILGARLAGASEEVASALASFGHPLGVAFQLRDDLLGVFGDPSVTGKPLASDLRKGKRTAVIVDALAHPKAAHAVKAVLGVDNASEQAIADALGGIEACGTADRIEVRIEELSRASCAALDGAAITARGRALLERAARDLTHRRS